MAGHQPQPVFGSRHAFGFSQQYPVMVGCFHTERDGQLFLAHIARRVGHERRVEIRVLPYPSFEQVVGGILALADHHDHFEAGWIILLHQDGQMLLQLALVVVGGHHDRDGGKRRRFFCYGFFCHLKSSVV